MKKAPKEPTDKSNCNFWVLPEPVWNKIVDWKLSGLSYPDIQRMLDSDSKLKVTCVSTLERFIQFIAAIPLQWQKFRPEHVTPVAWEAVRRKQESVIRDANSKPEQIKAALLVLTTGGRSLFAETNMASPPGLRGTRTARSDDSRNAEPAEENPLDDDAKLEELRLALFGPAPGEELAAPDAPTEPPPSGDVDPAPQLHTEPLFEI